jgi:methyltransferase (TIGR00027 family)
MKSGQPSHTAEYMAFFRACESVRPKGKRLFVDPLAMHFIRRSLRAAVWFSRMPIVGAFVPWYADHRLPGARTSAIARTRFIDDATRQGLRDNIRQIVIFGAGFDCRAHRLPGISNASVFEVDHEATLAWKLSRLHKVVPELPRNVRYVRVDFNRENVLQLLADAGFDSSLPAMFLWEGVTNYLTSEAVDSVLRTVSSCAPGSRIIFTYVHSGVLDGSVCFEGATELLNDVKQLGEPWTFGLDPAGVSEFLNQRGLRLDGDASAYEYRTQLYGTDALHMKGYEFYHVVIAHVATAQTAGLTAQQDETPWRLRA